MGMLVDTDANYHKTTHTSANKQGDCRHTDSDDGPWNC